MTTGVSFGSGPSASRSEATPTPSARPSRSSPQPIRTHRWTLDEVARYLGAGGIGHVEVGSPATVADELERWVEEADVDGFNLACATTPGTFVDLVVPELRSRGRIRPCPAAPRSHERLHGAADSLGPGATTRPPPSRTRRPRARISRNEPAFLVFLSNY
ncbi:hypothetical protein N8I84_02500 [Streptomyces cynarae]|uniref:LLM class flavin-dependent oxidoreductase n=1 Tax=Streptomyces cynarae TaxID=2981134 RepID=A0ABY6DTM9_9ACTN|nr:hypothetical protein [Streptomyces cynarae]UXY17731.1 hypothetical protein N8I84_02500 [Streptomyces cynarae]